MDYRNHLRITIGLAVGALTMAQAADGAAQTPPSPLIGGWTINKDLSSQPADGNDEANARRDRDRAGDRRGGGGGGGFRGGFGGGRRGGGGGRGAEAVDPDAIARMRDALRDLTNPPVHLVIVQTDSMIILTGPDGRTMRLSPDGKKIKDESTKTERKTKWDGGK